MFRFDFPNDNKNWLDWHQDSSSYHMTYPKFNAGVCWLALTKNTPKNGTLIYIKNSHEKYIHVRRSKKSESYSSQYKISLSKKERENIRNNIANSGDASFFHMNIKHKSGTNHSNKVRLTLACRYHEMREHFNVGKEIYLFNSNGKMDFI